jgi:hypothetical protein
MKIVAVALFLGLGAAVPAFCVARVPMPEPAMVGELAASAVGFAGLVSWVAKRKK